MPEFSDYIESLTSASALDGSEILGISQGGSARKITIADVGVGTLRATISTASSTITLNFVLSKVAVFLGSASFSTPKTIAHSNDGNVLQYDFHFEITNVAAKLTFPAGYIMSDVRWEAVNPQEWEPAEIGKYKATATYDGTNWWLEISPAPYV